MSKTTKIVLGVVIAAAVIVVMYVLSAYNGFVNLNETVDLKWANVETQYQRRLDLIPNLANVVKGALKQEQSVFGEIAEARTRYAGAKTVDEKVQAANQLEGAFSRLLVIVENYPQLKSIDAIRDMQAELAGTENRVAVERSRFNESVKEYNIKVKSIPSNIAARLFSFDARTMFEAEKGAEKAPTVNLDI